MNGRRTGLVAVLAMLAGACSTDPAATRPAMEEVYVQPPRPTYHTLGSGPDTLLSAQMPGAGDTPLLFIHGSPGDWQAWQSYLVDPALDAFGTRIAVDRPGFGGSAASGTITSMEEQARRIGALIDPAHPALVIGHSLGAPIALRLAADHPEKVRGVLLIAGAVSPQREGVRWYNHLASAFTWVLSSEWGRSNEEMYTLQYELELLKVQLPRVRCPILMVQGMKDTIVEPESAADFETMVPKAQLHVVRYPEYDHFVLWTHPELIDDAIRELDRWARTWSCPPAATPANDRAGGCGLVSPTTAAAPSPG